MVISDWRSDVCSSDLPVHSLVAGVMAGAGSPHLIVQGGASPHAISLKPSDATALQEAAVVFWVGEDLEAFLAPALESLAATASVVALAEVPGLVRLPYREGGPWAEHEHEHGHGHEHEHEHEEEHEHEHEAIDLHLWLDPDNATVMVGAIAAALAAADPANEALYHSNAERMTARLEALAGEIRSEEPTSELQSLMTTSSAVYCL